MYSAKYEDYKENIDVRDKYGIKDDVVVRSMCSRLRHLKIVNRREEGFAVEKYFRNHLSAAVIGLNNSLLKSDACPTKPELTSRWTDLDEQELHIQTQPNCYLILGKPGASSYYLGELLSKQLKCIHICPRNVLLDEMAQNTPVGKCIDFNMRHCNEMDVKTILRVIIRKLESPVVQHRGYIMSGIPLVSANRSKLSFFKQLFSEEAVLVADDFVNDFVMSFKKKKQKKEKKVTESGTSISSALGEGGMEGEEEEQEEEAIPEEEEDGEEEEDPNVELPFFLLDPCEELIFSEKGYYSSKSDVLLQQLDAILKVDMKPDVVIYITCPGEDLVTMRNHKYLDYSNESTYIDPQLDVSVNQQRWPKQYELSDYNSPIRHQSDSHPKYVVKPPINYTEKSIEQLCNYRNDVLPFLEKKMTDINPEIVIKIDGRTSVPQMAYHVTERLQMLPVKKLVHVPQPLYLEEADDMQEFWKSIEGTNIIKYENTLIFNHYPSLWNERCPVELQKRRSVRGKTKYAVAFYKHVFLLSSLDALITFWKNPRPYLKFDFLEPTCRIIVMGTKSSGKTMVSECLSWLFDTPIINYQTMYDEEKRKKYDACCITILSEIIPTIEDARLEKWNTLESERITKLEDWHTTALGNLKKYISLWNEIDRQNLWNEIKKSPSTSKTVRGFQNVKELLHFLPFIDDLQACKTVLDAKDLLVFAPAQFIITTEVPSAPVLGDPDVKEAIDNYIVAHEMQNEIEPDPEEIANVVISTIENIDKKSFEKFNTYGKYIIEGFDPNPDVWEFLNSRKMLPDNTIVLIENRDVDEDLLKHYMKLETIFKHHRERYIKADDPLIKIKLQILEEFSGALKNLVSPVLDVQKIIYDIVMQAMLSDIDDKGDSENLSGEEISTFTQAIETFRGNWENTKTKLEEQFKSFIEVELEDKTDLQILEEILLKLRHSYCAPCEPSEEEAEEPAPEDETPKDLLTYNDSRHLCETGIYCPISYFDYGVLWEGKTEFSLKYGNKMHFFAKEECLETFKHDWTKYQFFNQPYKKIPPWRICVMGCIGSGRSTLSKLIAKELGLLHVDFEDAVNNLLMPRHIKKVGRRYENIFTDVSLDEEQVVEFQMGEEGDESQVTDMLFNENEIRHMVYDYFEKGTPMLSVLMQKLLKKLWFEHPFVDIGVVIDGFPRVSNDVENMADCFCIPDIVLELESSSEVAMGRLSKNMYQTWKMQQTVAKNIAKTKFAAQTAKWKEFIAKNVIPKVLLENLITEIVIQCEPVPELPGEDNAPPPSEPPTEIEDNEFLTTLYNQLVEENPAPVDESEWEDNESARERIDGRIESIYEFDDEGIQSLKDLLIEQKIKLTTVDATKPIKKVFKKALLQLSFLIIRNDFFEQTFVIDNETAKSLLSEGHYFLSKFSRMCPVYMCENPNAILNPYKINRRNNTIFPVVHRTYIYFIHGEDSVRKFRSKPLQYCASDVILSFHQYPLRLAVIGPPKSGKSTLAERLAKQYGLICISRGSAIRNVLENLHWTKLASIMNSALLEGGCIDYDHVMSAVQTALIDYRTQIHGFVLDGFPDYPPEAMTLEQSGLNPLVVFDMCVIKDKLLDTSQNEIYYDIIKYIPPYPPPFIEHKFSKWSDRAYSIRDFIKGDFQNLVTLNANESKWMCFTDAKAYIESIIPKIHFYIVNVHSNKVLPVDAMCISNETLKRRCSSYKNLCPVCLQKQVLRHSQEPVDRKCIVQFKGLFYWICPEHMVDVIKKPEKFLLSGNANIPEIPAVVKTISPILVYENGVCIVTYAENLPAQIIKTGSYKHAVSYKGFQYLFCNRECLEKFLEKPHMYFDITVFKDTKSFPQISLKKLPNIGYLEQSVGDILTKACCAVNVLRPKYPGLDVKLSGLIFIGLYLKLHNPLLDECAYPYYKKAYDVYEARSRYIISLGLRMRSMDNPFASYPRCCGRKHSDSTVCKPATTLDSAAFVDASSKDDDNETIVYDY